MDNNVIFQIPDNQLERQRYHTKYSYNHFKSDYYNVEKGTKGKIN